METTPTGSSRTSRLIAAPREALYRAFVDPAALTAWLVPGEMTATLEGFDARVGGGYRMTLGYPPSKDEARAKTTAREDRYTARYVEMSPPARIVQAIVFETTDPGFAGEMTMVATLEERDAGTEVTIAFANLPPGIRPEDNDAGTRSSLEKLACYVGEGHPGNTPSSTGADDRPA